MNRSMLAIGLAACVSLPSVVRAQPKNSNIASEKAQRDEINRIKLELDLAKQRQAKKLQALELELKELQAKQRLAEEKHKLALAKLEEQKRKLSLENQLESERQKAQLAKLKRETALIQAQTTLARAKHAKEAVADEAEQLKHKREMAAMQLKSMRLKHEQMLLMHNVARYRNALTLRDQREKWRAEANKEPDRRKNPFRNGVLTVSDRRIPLNGPIVTGVGKYVTDRIQYFNNVSSDPIFIIIDSCPGGSVMEGYRIVQAMLSSKAPVHVVVKSFAASMAAVITTLAKHSYAYPNAIILHHEMRSAQFGNMTQLKERLEMAKKWERRLMHPVARKLGMTIAQFRKRMYENNSDGDWQEFADKAKQLKWVGHVVNGINETGIVKKPDEFKRPRFMFFLGQEKRDAQGRRYVELPRLRPLDVYWMYNPDNYYRM